MDHASVLSFVIFKPIDLFLIFWKLIIFDPLQLCTLKSYFGIVRPALFSCERSSEVVWRAGDHSCARPFYPEKQEAQKSGNS